MSIIAAVTGVASRATISVLLPALLGLLAGAAPAHPSGHDSAAPVCPAIQQELDALAAELRELRLRQSERWLTEQRVAEVRGLIQEVLTDADNRVALQGAGTTAGWDQGFFLASPDGNFRLAIGGFTQFRYVYNRRRGDSPDVDRNTHGFENGRSDVIFTGHVIDPSWSFRIQSGFSRGDDGTLGLKDAFVTKSFDNGFFVRAGQFKSPFMRETLVSETNLLAVERTLIESEFGAGRTQGVALGWSGEWLKVIVSYNDGIARRRGFNVPALDRDVEWSFTGRADLRLAGEWSQWNQLTSFPGESFGAFIGGAIGVQRDEYGTPDIVNSLVLLTVDGSMHFGGAHLFASYTHRADDPRGLPTSFNDWGAVVQGSFFAAPTFEVFGRYEIGEVQDLGPDLSLLTVGANWYIARQRLRLTSDFGYAFTPVGAGFVPGLFGTGGAAAGWQPDGFVDGSDGQIVVRSQLQFVF